MVILGIVLIVRKPEIIKQTLIKHYDLRPHVVLDEHVHELQEFGKQKVFELSVPNGDPAKLIIDIPGGAFISSVVTFVAYRELRLPCNVVSLTYPVLFENKAKETLAYLEETITKILATKSQVKTVYMVGTSAGAYYATKLINRGKIPNIRKFIGICGYYGHKTIPKNITISVLEQFYVTSFKNNQQFDCQIISNPIKSLFMTSTRDFLGESTMNFATQNHVRYEVFEGDHLFFFRIDQEGAKRAHILFNHFINEKDTTTTKSNAVAT